MPTTNNGACMMHLSDVLVCGGRELPFRNFHFFDFLIFNLFFFPFLSFSTDKLLELTEKVDRRTIAVPEVCRKAVPEAVRVPTL